MMESAASRERYGQEEVPADKLIPQGVKAQVDFQGDVSKIIFQLLGGLRDGMGYLGAKTIAEMQKRADFHRITLAGLQESHPHGLGKIASAPNYKA